MKVFALAFGVVAACGGRAGDDGDASAPAASATSSAPADAGPARSSVDTSKLGPKCVSADNWTCPKGSDCASLVGVDPSNTDHYCVDDADPCGAITCVAPRVCEMLESFPGQLACLQN